MILVTYKNRPGINMTAYCLSRSYLSLNDSTFLLSKHNSKQWLFQYLSLLFAGLHIQLIPHQVGPQYSFEVYRILHRSSTISHGYHQSPQIRCNTSCSLTKAPRPPDAVEPPLANCLCRRHHRTWKTPVLRKAACLGTTVAIPSAGVSPISSTVIYSEETLEV